MLIDLVLSSEELLRDVGSALQVILSEGFRYLKEKLAEKQYNCNSSSYRFHVYAMINHPCDLSYDT